MLVILTTDRMKHYQSLQPTGHFGKYVTAAAVLTFLLSVFLRSIQFYYRKTEHIYKYIYTTHKNTYAQPTTGTDRKGTLFPLRSSETHEHAGSHAHIQSGFPLHPSI